MLSRRRRAVAVAVADLHLQETLFLVGFCLLVMLCAMREGALEEIAVGQEAEQCGRRYWVISRSPQFLQEYVIGGRMLDSQYYDMFRLTRLRVFWIIEDLTPALQRQYTNFRAPWSPADLVHTFLARLGHGSSYKLLGFQFGIGTSSVSKAVRDVVDALLVRYFNEWVRFPSLVGMKRTREAFSEYGGLPNVVGALDGTHIPIQRPSTCIPPNNRDAFFNRKGFYSFNVQVVVDRDGRCAPSCLYG